MAWVLMPPAPVVRGMLEFIQFDVAADCIIAEEVLFKVSWPPSAKSILVSGEEIHVQH